MSGWVVRSRRTGWVGFGGDIDSWWVMHDDASSLPLKYSCLRFFSYFALALVIVFFCFISTVCLCVGLVYDGPLLCCLFLLLSVQVVSRVFVVWPRSPARSLHARACGRRAQWDDPTMFFLFSHFFYAYRVAFPLSACCIIHEAHHAV